MTKIDFWRETDISPLPGYVPLLEAWGRKRRLTAGRIIAQEVGLELPTEIAVLTPMLFNIYWDTIETGGYTIGKGEFVSITETELNDKALKFILSTIKQE